MTTMNVSDGIKTESSSSVTDNPTLVTADDARQSIVQVITYLQACHNTEIYIQTLRQIMQFINDSLDTNVKEETSSEPVVEKMQVDQPQSEDDFDISCIEVKTLGSDICDMSTAKTMDFDGSQTTKKKKIVKMKRSKPQKKARKRVEGKQRSKLISSNMASTSKTETTQHTADGQNTNVENVNEKSKKSDLNCSICNHKFAKLDELHKHFKAHKGQENKCHSKLTRHLNEHDHTPGDGKQISNEPPEFVCKICDKKMEDPISLQVHFEKHEGQINNHCCAYCGNKFYDSKNLRKHLLTHRFFTCDYCGNSFLRLGDVFKHKKNYHDWIGHDCDICGKTFKEDYMPVHKLIHTGEKPFSCKECGRKYKSSRGLKDHTASHTESLPYQCDKCDKGYNSLSGLSTHKKSVHSGMKANKVKTHVCSYCGFAFSKRSSLLDHEYKHKDTPRFRCEYCDETFIWRAKYLTHARRHEGLKKYPCEVCNKSFIDSSQRIMHMRVHTGERPYECNVCGKRFAITSNLKRHLVVHSGAKPYVCGVCGKAFTQSSSLKLHTKRVHPELVD